MKNLWKRDFKRGIKSGLAIGLGYLPVSFTFGLLAVSGGLPVWVAAMISLTNLTSAGQFAGTNLIIAGAGYIEVAVTVFVINIRYMLMSLSLSQKLTDKVGLLQRMICAFGITDETFVVASMESKKITPSYMYGLILPPIIGWNAGTLLGGCVSTLLPELLKNSMGIALYAMFIALIIPASKETKGVIYIILVAVIVMCILKYIPIFAGISSGFKVVIATIIGATFGAIVFTKEEDYACESN